MLKLILASVVKFGMFTPMLANVQMPHFGMDSNVNNLVSALEAKFAILTTHVYAQPILFGVKTFAYILLATEVKFGLDLNAFAQLA